MEHSLISEIAICIIVAWIFAVVAQLCRQPLILAYLLAGLAIGPVGARLVHDPASIETISGLGLILLLFMIGLDIDLKKILGAGKLILVTSGVQIVGGCVLGIAFFYFIGFPFRAGALDALYLAVAAALSSTVIIVKILYEKRELDTLGGRLTVGILVIQDLFAILFLAIQPDLGHPRPAILFLSLGKVALLVAVAFTASRYALPPIFRAVARLPELVLVGAVAWCFLIAAFAGRLGLSLEMGALVAGVAISTFPYALDVVARVTTLRDFFVTLFFVALGMAIPAPNPSSAPRIFAVLLFVILSRMLTVFPSLYRMKQGFRASLLPAINLCQISELSLVILSLGVRSGHLSARSNGIMAYAFAVLGVASSYAITRSDSVLGRMIPWLRRIGLKDIDQRHPVSPSKTGHRNLFILGFSWTASSLLEEMTRHMPEVLAEMVVIDFNPNVNQELRARGVSVIYGDIAQRETLVHAGIAGASVIVSSLPNTVLKGVSNLRLLQQLRQCNATAKIIVHAELFSDVPKLYAAGADYVSVPRLIEAQDLCDVIRAARANELTRKRAELDSELANRHEVIP